MLIIFLFGLVYTKYLYILQFSLLEGECDPDDWTSLATIIKYPLEEGGCLYSYDNGLFKYLCDLPTEYRIRHYEGDIEELCSEARFISETNHDLQKCYGGVQYKNSMDMCLDDITQQLVSKIDRYYSMFERDSETRFYYANKKSDIGKYNDHLKLSTKLDCSKEKVLVLDSSGETVEELGKGGVFGDNQTLWGYYITIEDIYCGSGASNIVKLSVVMIIIFILVQ